MNAMSPIPVSRAATAAAWLAAVAGVAISACSLGLGNEDGYFAAADAAGNQMPLSEAAPGSDGATGVDGTASSEASAADDATSTPGTDSGSGGGMADVDAGANVALPPAVLQLYYSFDDYDAGDGGSGIVVDHSGNNLTAELKGDSPPLIDPLGHTGHCLTLDGSQHQYAQLPAGVVASFESISVASWINLKVPAIWNRLFDFNISDSVWIYFSPTGWNPTTMQPGTHFAISTGTHLDPEMILTDTVPTGAWHHVAIVLSAPYLIYYFDGVEKSRLTNMTLGPKDLGSTPQNWIGRSSYTADPYLSASVDEFRIYSGALTPQEVAQLAAQ
jgi:hypothetical protein